MLRTLSDAHTSGTVRGLRKSVSKTARRQLKRMSFVQVSQREHNKEKGRRNGLFPKSASHWHQFFWA